MFAASATQFIGTEKGAVLMAWGLLIAFMSALVSALVGFVGLFARGYSLGRVPFYFVIGFAMTFAIVRILQINLFEWPAFTALLR